MPDIKHIVIHTDGACRGNPGPGGWGAILIWGDKVKELSGGEDRTTNNRMELTAVIKALEALKEPVEVDVYSDSVYVVRGITEWVADWISRGWKRSSGPVENIELWQRLVELNDRHQVRYHWVRGHDGNELNERADRLAVSAIPK